MSRPRRWPLHPEPLAGEALSSWLTRLAQLYDLSVPDLLRYNLGALVDVRSPRDLDPLSLDLDPPGSVLVALQERTGVDEQDLRRMTIAGWVPWLLDDVQPDEGTEAFTTWPCQVDLAPPFLAAVLGASAAAPLTRRAGRELAPVAACSTTSRAHEQSLPPVRQRSGPRADADGEDPHHAHLPRAQLPAGRRLGPPGRVPAVARG